MAKKKSAPETSTPEGAPSTWRESLYRPIVLFWLAVFCLAPLGYSSFQKFRTRMLNSPRFELTEQNFVWKSLPETLPEDWSKRVTGQLLADESLSLNDPQLAKTVGEKLQTFPWVRSVRKVALTYPRTVTIDVEVRQPVAMVQIKTGFYPIDHEGVLLPPEDFSAADITRYPVIFNPDTLPQGPAGIVWGDPAIAASARLAELLLQKSGTEESSWKKFGLKSIRIERSQSAALSINETTLVLISEGGSRFIWGLPPGHEAPKEPSADNKLKRLAHFVRDFGSPATYRHALEVDLRPWQEITYQPLKITAEKRPTSTR